MLTKKASAPIRAVKFGLLAPLALLFALLFRQAPAIAQVVDQEHLKFVQDLESKNWVMTDTVITFDPTTYEETMRIVRNSAAPEADENGKLVFQYAEVQPQFPGGQEAMFKFLVEQVHYPESASQSKVEGTVYVHFVVDESGNILRPFGQVNEPNDSKFQLIEEAVRVVKSMPKWIPATHKGKTVRCSVTLPVKFKLTNPAPKPAIVDPEFPGGAEAMMKFLAEHIKYPEVAKKANASGMVVVQFVVKEDGSLTEVGPGKNELPLHPDLVAEAIRVVKEMPKWKPALDNGKVVSAKICIPIKFKLTGN